VTGGEPSIRATYDAGGRLTQLFENERLALSQRWNHNGQVAAVETPTSATRYEYDNDGVLAGFVVTPPDHPDGSGGWTRTRLDRVGNPIEITDAHGLRSAYSYDPGGALISTVQQSGEAAVTTSIVRDQAGRPVRLTSATGQAAYTYDGNDLSRVDVKRGATISTMQFEGGKVKAVCGFDQGVTRMTYGRDSCHRDRLSGIECANGLRIGLDYDDEGRPVGASAGGERRVGLSYDERGRVASYRWEKQPTPAG
jgi:YD repeat-containing protein